MKHSDVNHKIEPWTITTDAALAHLDSSAGGLTEAEARQRLERFGPNRLKEKPQRPVWMKFLDQFKNLLVIVLIGAAVGEFNLQVHHFGPRRRLPGASGSQGIFSVCCSVARPLVATSWLRCA